MKKIKTEVEKWQCKQCGETKSYKINKEGLSIMCRDFACEDDDVFLSGDFTDIMELIEKRITKEPK